jgi:LCP family protein required for cell wall assembly
VRGDGFGPLVAFTTLGAVVPGAGLVAAGRRRLGWALVTLFALGLLLLAVVALSGRAADVGLAVATRPNALLLVAGVVVAVAVVWCLVVVGSFLALRRHRLTVPQRLLSAALVASLLGIIALPSATAARYAMAQRSLVLTVFDESGPEREAGLAAPDTESKDPWADTPRINVMLLGSDAGTDRIGTRPDTIVVASIDTHTGDTVLFSLPRNMERVPFPEGTPGDEEFPKGFYCPGHQECLINGIWSWAEANSDLFPGEQEPGLAATRQAVGEALGLQIDYYALVNLQGFEDVVDAIGGLRMDVERKIPIGGGTNQLTGGKYPITGWIHPGRQTLDGYHALWYARSREGSDDYDRMARQRCVIAAVREQAEPVKLAKAFPRLAASAERNVETDIRASELDAFVELAQRVQKGTLRSLPFTNEVINPANPDYEAIQELVQQAIDPPPPATASPSPSGSAEPTTPTPTETETGSGDTGADAPNPDPEQAVAVDEVCG